MYKTLCPKHATTTLARGEAVCGYIIPAAAIVELADALYINAVETHTTHLRSYSHTLEIMSLGTNDKHGGAARNKQTKCVLFGNVYMRSAKCYGKIEARVIMYNLYTVCEGRNTSTYFLK